MQNTVKMSWAFLLVLNFVSVFGIPSTFTNRIMGGSRAEENQYPYQVSIQYLGHTCGGSIIDDLHILTAAHCLTNRLGNKLPASFLTVKVGSNHIEYGGINYDIKTYKIHPQYDQDNRKNDIAIIILRNPLEFNKSVQPVQLETQYVDKGVDCVLSGWGAISYPLVYPDELQELKLETVSNEECNKYYPDVDESQICTSQRDHRTGALFGDSGSPVVANGRQIGIASYISGCIGTHPDVYTRVSYYIDWIKSVVLGINKSDNLLISRN